VTGSWDDADRVQVERRVRDAARLPGVEAVETAGHTSFSVGGKRFAWLLVDHHGDGQLALQVKAAPGVQEALVAERGCFSRPAYLGSRGWVAVDLAPDGGADWDRVEQLIEQAWRMSATKRLLAQRPLQG
jgi:hypothetical protein